MINQDKVNKMRAQVAEEMKKIPRGDEAQNWFRQYYSAGRMNSLGKRAKYNSRKEVIEAATKAVAKDYKGFKPIIKK